MVLHEFIIDNAEKWIAYERPAVDWYGNGKDKPSRKLQKILQLYPSFGAITENIPHQLARQSVWNCYQDDLYMGFIATILWDVLYRDHVPVNRILPVFKEPADSVRTKMETIRKHLCREETLSFVYEAANSPSKLHLAKGVSPSVFTLVMDFLATDIKGITHPLMFNHYMQRVHCALMIEEMGSADPFYIVEDNKLRIAEGASEAECYEKYCEMLGDLSLEVGWGNPERLVEWLNYSDEAHEASPIIREVIKGISSTPRSSRDIILGIEMPPLGAVDSLEDCPEQDFTGKDDQIADYVVNLFMTDDDNCKLMYHIMDSNGLIENRKRYAKYNTGNKGCSIDNPFVIEGSKFDINIAIAICEYLLHWTSSVDKRAELSNQILRSRNGRSIFNLIYNVFIDGSRSQEHYFFDVTSVTKLH